MAQEVALNTKLVEQVVNLTLYDVPHDQICSATSLTPDALSALMETAEYKDLLAAGSTEEFEQNKTLNEGWDSAEASALAVINTNLEWNQDPDFALRAAAIANKARRRGKGNEHQLPAVAGARAVINLGSTYINNLQISTAGTKVGRTLEALEQKQTDFLDVKKVEDLLGLNREEQEVEKLLLGANFGAVPTAAE